MIQLALLAALLTAQAPSSRTMAVTFDDLPVAGRTVALPARESVTTDLLRAITWHRVTLNAFLAAHGDQVAPVTIDNSDYVFASAFPTAREARDTAQAARIAAEYLDYMERVVAWYEGQAVAIAGREIPQVLLLHANALNAATFDSLAAMLRGRGYRFISLAEALKDPVYHSPDTYAGEPEVAGWVGEIARR